MTPDVPKGRARHPFVLLVVLLATGVALGIAPNDREVWTLENLLTVASIALLVLTYRRFRLSLISYTLIFTFLMLHQVGAHYTYAEVPYDSWFRSLTGSTLSELVGAERNHYDRLVHFSFGLLLSYPMRELFVRIAEARGFWGYSLPLQMVISTSALFELLEWAAAEVFGGGVGTDYLGSQGDVWDAQKDMLLATVGSILALGIVAAIHRSRRRDFQREWAASLRVKQVRPPDE